MVRAEVSFECCLPDAAVDKLVVVNEPLIRDPCSSFAILKTAAASLYFCTR